MAVRTAGRLAVAALIVCVGVPGAESCFGAVYVCGSDSLQVDPVGNWDAVVLHLDGGLFLLQQTVAASGVRYSDGDRTFWMKGESAFVEVGGVIAKDGCRLVRRAEEDPQVGAGLLDLPVLSCSPVDATGFNASVRAAFGAGETWPLDAVRVALEFIGSLDGRVAALVKVDSVGEGAACSTVTVVCDGLLDDSVRGTWNELRLARTEAGAWEIAQASRAYRCWRGQHGRSYSAELCL